MKRYEVFWSPAISAQFDGSTIDYRFEIDPGKLDCRGGVYQIYGDHPCYGRDSLLYIGRTDDFTQRLTEHIRGQFWNHVGLSVRLGVIYQGKHPCENPDVQAAVEALLIAAHQPALNRTAKFTSELHMEDEFIVFNWDWRGDLAPEVSSLLLRGPFPKATPNPNAE